MNRLPLTLISASALIFGLILPRDEAVAQTANGLVGTWTLVSVTLEKDGKAVDFYGPNPTGQVIFDAGGHFSFMLARADLPKFASNNRSAGTSEENKAIVQGSIAFFGTYLVSDTDKTYTFHIESCTFPNWNGTERKESFSISGDELNVMSLSKSSTGSGNVHLVWKRAKPAALESAKFKFIAHGFSSLA
jgi:hypothetical protein